jgi:hypothetical protein
MSFSGVFLHLPTLEIKTKILTLIGCCSLSFLTAQYNEKRKAPLDETTTKYPLPRVWRFATSVFVAPQGVARFSEPLVPVAVLPRISASEIEALPTLLVIRPRHQQRHKSNAPQLAIHCR